MGLVTNYQSANSLSELGLTEEKPTLLYIGPYATNYSLARVNRGLATALRQNKDLSMDVKIWKNPPRWIDHEATDQDLAEKPELKDLLTTEPGDPQVVIFNDAPSSSTNDYGLADLPGELKIMYIALEESVFPADKVAEINNHMHGVMAASQFTADILRKNGIKLPIKVVPNALDPKFFDLAREKYTVDTKKSFKFLHISTARQRKGVDVLLKAYFNKFSGDDDVTLVIKSFPGPDNLVNDLLGKLTNEHENSPEVIHVMDPNLTEGQLIDLTVSANACIYPTRAEGFGLPIAEAMYLERPVITTGYSGHMDFCSPENTLLLDYKLVDAIDSEMVNIGAKWAEPDQSQLEDYMMDLFQHSGDTKYAELGKRAKAAASQLTWGNSAVKATEFIQKLVGMSGLKERRLGVVTTFNTTGGISEYSKYLYASLEASFNQTTYFANSDIADLVRPDESNVIRCWEMGDNSFESCVEKIIEHKIDTVHIQHHTAEISPAGLTNLITTLQEKSPDTKIIVTLHDALESINKKLRATLGTIDRVLVHSKADFEELQKELTPKEVMHFPHPYHYFPSWDKQKVRQALGINENTFVIATHGIIAEHKGLLQTAEAISELKESNPNILWLAVNAVNINNASSGTTLDKLKQKIEELGISEQTRLFTQFFDSDLQVATLLKASDIGILAYDHIEEGASGAIRKFLAVGLPTIITETSILNDIDQAVMQISNNRAETISQKIQEFITLSGDKKQAFARQAKKISQSYSWNVASMNLLEIYV